MADMINKPPHYNKGAVEVWDFILDQGMGYLDGNAIKYICRYRHKGKPVEDLDKAIAFLTKLRDTEYAKQEPKLLPNGTFDKPGTIVIKPAKMDEEQAKALKEANERILERQRAELEAAAKEKLTKDPFYMAATGKDVFRGPYNSYNLNPYDQS